MFRLCYSLTVSEHFFMTYSKVRIKFSNHQIYWYLYIVGWGKTGPAHSFPPPKCSDLSIYLLVFWIILPFRCICTLLTSIPSKDSSFHTKQFISTSTFWSGGKTGLAHSFPPPKCFDLSIYLSVFWIMLLFHGIWTLLKLGNSKWCSVSS